MTKLQKVLKARCIALDSAGKRCRRFDTTPVQYHGDGELYSNGDAEPQWVKAYLCSHHLTPGRWKKIRRTQEGRPTV